MANYVHLPIKSEMRAVSSLVQTLEPAYVQYTNKRHGRVAPLLQGRCKSEPVNTNAYLRPPFAASMRIRPRQR